ncbi:MAG: hypothetical protein AAGA29_14350 [Planctomycetota bacterium]
MGRWLALAVACFGALLSAEAAQARAYGDLDITVQAPGTTSTSMGYAEYLVTVRNTSTSTARRVTLEIPNSRWGTSWGQSISRISRSVEVPAGSTVEVPLLQPALAVNGDGLRVTIDGERQEDWLPLEVGLHGGWDVYYGDIQAGLFCSQSIRGDVIDSLRSGLEDGAMSGSYHSTHFTLERSELAIDQWSPRWLAYTRYSAVVIANSDLAAMPQPVREAIDRYVHCGGTLVVLGEVDTPDAWGPANPIQRRSSGAGVGEIQGASLYAFGLGQCLVMSGDHYADWDYDDWDSVVALLDPGLSFGSYPASPEEANSAFPVVEDQGVPVRGLLIMMVLFAIIIGPVNLIVLHRLRRRLWTLWTVPAMSLLFSATVFGYAILSEGWGAVGRSASVTLLDENTMQASTIGLQGFYAPLTPSDGLHFERNTEVSAQIAEDYGYSRSGSSTRTIDWTHDQHLANGWVSARVPAHFQIRKSETRRERLELTRNEDGSYTVVNGLGAAIISLTVADTAGHTYTAGPIPAGGSGTLVKDVGLPGEPDGRTVLEQLRWGGSWGGVQRLTDGSHRNLRVGPGTYYAVLEGTPFMEIGLDNLSEHRSTSAVIGLMREPIDGN